MNGRKRSVPGFEDCQNEAKKIVFLFQNRIASTVNNALYEEELVANQEIDQEIILTIQISKDGEIALLSIDNASSVFNAVLNFPLYWKMLSKLTTSTTSNKDQCWVTVDSQLSFPFG